MDYLLFVAAEPSGDQHAAHLVRSLREKRPELEFGAFGGEGLRDAGCHLFENLMGSATMVVGFLGGLTRYLRTLRRFDRVLAERQPTAVVLVDSPGLNFLLARLARWRRVPVIYYICPQIWAWSPWRRSKVIRWTDLLMPILPFEEELYRDCGVPVRFVGHPLADELAKYSPEAGSELRRDLGIPTSRKVIGVFPGSRHQEVQGLADVFCRLIRRMAPAPEEPASVVVSCCRPEFRPVIEEAGRARLLEVEIFEGDARRLMLACDLAIVASGTASLELVYFDKPMAVLYRTNRFGRMMFRYFGVTPWMALPNILGCSVNDGQATVIEELFVGDPCDEVVRHAHALLYDGEERARAIDRLRRVKENVLRPGGVEKAATELLSFLVEKGLLG